MTEKAKMKHANVVRSGNQWVIEKASVITESDVMSLTGTSHGVRVNRKNPRIDGFEVEDPNGVLENMNNPKFWDLRGERYFVVEDL